MTQVAGTDTVATDFNGVELSLNGSDYTLLEDEGRLFVEISHTKPLDPEEPVAPAGRHEIVLTTGSHHLQFYWMATMNTRVIDQLPFAYMIKEERWTPMRATFLLPPAQGNFYAVGQWNRGCMDCHTTQGRPRVSNVSFQMDTQVNEFGISCAACHSEGTKHISKNQNPVRRYAHYLSGKPDDTIKNPKRLDGQKASLVCGQCHSIWNFSGITEKQEWNTKGSTYRAGDESLAQRYVVNPREAEKNPLVRNIIANDPHYLENRFWPDGMIRVTGREYNGVVDSPCYAGGEFSCLSCHTMHAKGHDRTEIRAWSDDQLKPEMRGNAACTQCHGQFENVAALQEHTRHQANSPGSSCYNCHMPYTTYGLLKAIRSHQVSNPSALESLQTGRPNACNLCHLDKTLASTADTLKQWYNQPVPTIPVDEKTIAASILWSIKGDAGQRALLAWSMGWKPAQEISGTEWTYPYLIRTMADPYEAVRFIAHRSLRSLSGFEDFDFDYTAEPSAIMDGINEAYLKWQSLKSDENTAFPAPLMLNSEGNIVNRELHRLLAQRNNRPVL